MLKKLSVFLLICATVLFPLRVSYASAQTNPYRRVITEDTPFFADSLGRELLFYLPYTYYVRVLGDVGDFYHVECYGQGQTPALDGFVPKLVLYNDNLPVSLPYLNLTIKTYTDTVFYDNQSLTTSYQYIFPERNLSYYGKATAYDGTSLYFVAYNGRLGYVKESAVYPFAIENHPNELTFIIPDEPVFNPEQTPDNEQTSNDRTSDYFSLKVIIVVCLAFAGLIAIFIAFKPKMRKKNATAYYDENDYE